MSSATAKQLQLFLTPTPGAKPEFLATLEASPKTPLDSSLPDKIVLENYTRDAWAWKPNPSVWQTLSVQAVDGRNKLPGFLKYLKERQKSAYGRFADKEAIWVISYIQKSANNNTNNNNNPAMECRFAWDISTVPGCPHRSPSAVAAEHAPEPPPPPKPVAAPPKRKGGAGLLGKLVSSQKRTNEHVQVASSKPPNNHPDTDGTNADGKKTAMQVMAEFRQSMEEKMLDFDLSAEPVLKVELSLSKYTKDLATLDDKAKITMEILKYMVYEQAEEVNEEWVAYKEPSEFMDECVISVYKEGQAPSDVLEELNKGELPDEVRGQERALQAERQKQADMKDLKRKQELQRKALKERAEEDEDETAALNQNKRDRRTIEEIQREQNKRART